MHYDMIIHTHAWLMQLSLCLIMARFAKICVGVDALAPGSTPGIWEKRDLAIAWRCAHAATCGAICLTLFLGDPNIVFGPVAPLFWTSCDEHIPPGADVYS